MNPSSQRPPQKHRRHGLWLLALLALGGPRAGLGQVDLARLQLPPGFVVSVWADVPDARQMALSPRGIVYVGSRTLGQVRAVEDVDRDGRADRVRVIASGLEAPTGLAYRDGSLYVGAVSRILRFDEVDANVQSPLAPVAVADDLPTDAHHGWKTLAFGPDGLLYVPVGAPCNVCLKPLPYASILRMRADGSARETVAEGVRNTVGFAWHPVTRQLWFTDNGRDWLGDDQPSCELNRLTRAGQHFGFPFVHGKAVQDPDFHALASRSDFTPPVFELGPHVAPLGLLFYTGSQFPADYRNSLLVAEHGSWNRSRKNGYRVMRLVLDDAGNVLREEPFITGWLRDEEVSGRPVAFLQLPDGSVLLSDDKAGVIYRITYRGRP